jgi:hypothetical protein
MTKAAPQTLIDPRALKAQSHPIRAEILNILWWEGPNSPSRMHRRMEIGSLQLVCHHVKILREVGLIELVRVKEYGGRKEHIYRATRQQYFTLEEWLAVDPKLRDPVIGTILRQISDDTGRAAAEGRFSEFPDSHLKPIADRTGRCGMDGSREGPGSSVGAHLGGARSEQGTRSGQRRGADGGTRRDDAVPHRSGGPAGMGGRRLGCPRAALG